MFNTVDEEKEVHDIESGRLHGRFMTRLFLRDDDRLVSHWYWYSYTS